MSSICVGHVCAIPQLASGCVEVGLMMAGAGQLCHLDVPSPASCRRSRGRFRGSTTGVSFWKGHYFDDLGDDLDRRRLLERDGDDLPHDPCRLTAARSPRCPTETAFSRRDAAFEFVAASRWRPVGRRASDGGGDAVYGRDGVVLERRLRGRTRRRRRGRAAARIRRSTSRAYPRSRTRRPRQPVPPEPPYPKPPRRTSCPVGPSDGQASCSRASSAAELSMMNSLQGATS